MTRTIFVCALLSLAACGSGAQGGTEPDCTAGEYACVCATGSYCLQRGAACRTPDSECPPAPAADGGEAQCAPLQHECKCATGSYCLAAGAACINPTAACPTP